MTKKMSRSAVKALSRLNDDAIEVIAKISDQIVQFEMEQTNASHAYARIISGVCTTIKGTVKSLNMVLDATREYYSLAFLVLSIMEQLLDLQVMIQFYDESGCFVPGIFGHEDILQLILHIEGQYMAYKSFYALHVEVNK